MQEILKKFKFRGNGVAINAPSALAKELVKTGVATAFNKHEKSTNTLVFIPNREAYLNFLEKELENVAPDSVLWFAYPKTASKVKTDINRDTLRATGEEFGITTVTAISIDSTWSALRFRPVDKVGKRY